MPHDDQEDTVMTLTVQTVLYDGCEDVDFAGPITAFGIRPDVRHEFVTVDDRATITTSTGTEIVIRGSWSPESADLLIVPGGRYGPGSGVFEQLEEGSLVQALEQAQRPGLTVVGVCTGVMLLSAAGITTGRPCNTHHLATEDLRAQGGKVVNARVVDDGDLVTSGGVLSGVDLGIWLTERYWGQEAALFAQEVMEYERRGVVWRTPTPAVSR